MTGYGGTARKVVHRNWLVERLSLVIRFEPTTVHQHAPFEWQ